VAKGGSPVVRRSRVKCRCARSRMILPPLSMDLGLLLISIGVVNLWRIRQSG
jgi:hypothetical protein